MQSRKSAEGQKFLWHFQFLLYSSDKISVFLCLATIQKSSPNNRELIHFKILLHTSLFSSGIHSKMKCTHVKSTNVFHAHHQGWQLCKIARVTNSATWMDHISRIVLLKEVNSVCLCLELYADCVYQVPTNHLIHYLIYLSSPKVLTLYLKLSYNAFWLQCNGYGEKC